jgi:hypothetical protein
MRVPRRHVSALAAALTVMVTLAGCAGAGAGDTRLGQAAAGGAGAFRLAEGPPVPVQGAYFGARVRGNSWSQRAEIASVTGLQTELGRRLDIVHEVMMWDGKFPEASVQAFLRQGSTLLLSWSGADTRMIASGAYDSLIRQRAQQVRALGKPIFLEWRWEMDRPNIQYQIHSPADYIAAWDHIRAIFRQEHVTNAAWVWCPTAAGFAAGTAPRYYPGNSEVDWLCADAYPGYGPYRSFATVTGPFLRWASHYRKPVMIGEYGVPGTYGEQRRAQWLLAAARTVQSHPQIKALVYFDANAKRAYALNPGSPAMQAFRRMAHYRYFNPGVLP